MRAPKLAVDKVVPVSIRLDVARVISAQPARAQVTLINIPAEDFASTIDALMRSQPIFMPFTPTLCGYPIAPWEKDIIGVMARQDVSEDRPIILTASGAEQEV